MFDIFKLAHTIKKTFTRTDVIIITLLVLAFFGSRFIRLDSFPIFNDEGIYIQWAKLAKADPALRFISLTDGKQPLQTWGTIPLLKVFKDNALMAGRTYAVMAGFAGMVGIAAVLYLLFGKKAAYLGALFYIIAPYSLFYDRMALADASVNAACVWILFFSILLAKYRRLDIALLFGFAAGFGMLTKSSVQVFLGLSALAPLLFVKKIDRESIDQAINYYVLLAVSVAIAVGIYNIQRLSPWFQYIAQKNLTFVMSFSELKQTPFLFFNHNLIEIPLNVAWESGFVLTLIGVAGLIMLLRTQRRLGLYIGSWALIFFTIVAFIAKVTFPRYFIFLNTIFLIMAAYALASEKLRKYTLIGVTLVVISVAYFDYTIVFAQDNIPFPPVDRGQYIEGWPAGGGVKETMMFLRQKAQEKPVILLGEGNFGLTSDVFNSLIKSDDRIVIDGYWPLGEPELRANQKKLKDHNIYAFFPHRTEFPPEWPLKLIKKFDKPNSQSAFYLFELLP